MLLIALGLSLKVVITLDLVGACGWEWGTAPIAAAAQAFLIS